MIDLLEERGARELASTWDPVLDHPEKKKPRRWQLTGDSKKTFSNRSDCIICFAGFKPLSDLSFGRSSNIRAGFMTG
jgi:hypothetical protein